MERAPKETQTKKDTPPSPNPTAPAEGTDIQIRLTRRSTWQPSPRLPDYLLEDELNKLMDPREWNHEPAIGGPQGGDLYVALAPGYTASADLQGRVVEAIPPRGEHLLSPERPAMLASFVIAGPGISKGTDLGLVRQVDVAPTLGALLGIEAPAQAVGSPLCAALARFGSAPGVESAPSHSIRCASPPRLDSPSPP